MQIDILAGNQIYRQADRQAARLRDRLTNRGTD
jgi:hypothetical protein